MRKPDEVGRSADTAQVIACNGAPEHARFGLRQAGRNSLQFVVDPGEHLRFEPPDGVELVVQRRVVLMQYRLWERSPNRKNRSAVPRAKSKAPFNPAGATASCGQRRMASKMTFPFQA